MKLTKITILAFMLVLSNFNLAFAEDEAAAEEEILSAKELLVSCEDGSTPGAPNQYCMRYVFGLVQTVMGLQQADGSAPLFCINPQQVRLEAATDNVIDYLRTNAKRGDEDAFILVTEALNKKYPCSL